MQTKLGQWLVVGLLCAVSAQALAQVKDAAPRSDAQSLACLAKPAEPPEFPEKSTYDDGQGFLRVKLTFSKPDAAPEVQVLVNTARQDMQDQAFRYLKQMRLPCLQASDGAVEAVQEFNFTNSPLTPLALDPIQSESAACVVMPRKDMTLGGDAPVKPAHVVVAMVFDGDGEKPPQARVLYANGDERYARMTLNRVEKYRMPCRKAGDKPVMLRQYFRFSATDQSKYVLRNKVLPLGAFLGMTEGLSQLEADFDTRTMGCPFKLNFTIYGPKLPNEVSTGGERDPNKLAFVKWMEERQLAFKDADMANDLFGQTLQINVPCGRLLLSPKATAPKAAAAASSAG